MTPRLSRQMLACLPGAVRRPDFDPAGLRTGIVHIGLGVFARAHLGWHTQPLLAGDPSWGILGVSLRSAATRDALAPQDGLYLCAERGGNEERLTAMGVLTGILVGPENPAAVVRALADPATRIVTLSVTEKGYHRLPAQGVLDEDDPSIRHDLANPDALRTVPGFLVAALRARTAAGVPPFTVLCCDNLPANGNSTRRVVVRFAELLDPALGRFIADEVAFPNTMVDRIVPATTDGDRERIALAAGVRDAWPVVCEPFSQWVIEDRFPLGRPAWERAGAEVVGDVHPYEMMKLRMLNGSHSAIAYLGQLAGWQTVFDAITEPAMAFFIDSLIGEAAAALRMLASVDLRAHRSALLKRFATPALRHRTAQVATDGSQKMPQRLFATAVDRLAGGLDVPCVALATAAWLRFLQGRSDDGSPLSLDDPKKDALLKAARTAGDPRSLCDTIFAMDDIVPSELARATLFRDGVQAALESLTTLGVRGTLNKWREKRHEERTDGNARNRRLIGGGIISDGTGRARAG